MALASGAITGSQKQGLGFCLVVDGIVFPAKINDPGSLTVTRNTLDATYSKTTDFKASIPEELSEPLEWDMTVFFDPTLQALWDLITQESAVTKKEIYLFMPVVPTTPAGFPGYIFLPEGFITADSIVIPLDELMTQEVKVSGGTANPIIQKQVTLTALTAVIVTPDTVVGPTADQDVLGALSATGLLGTGFYEVTAGVDQALVTVSADNKNLLGVGILTSTSGDGGAGLLVFDVTVEDITLASFIEVGMNYTITA